jgi:hypothetical protein
MFEIATTTRVAQAVTKLALGTSFYVLLLSVAYYFPTAGGMMLTFPALNGLALAAAPKGENAEGATRTMLFMPVLNGLLCALYIFSFLWLKPDGALFGILTAIGVIWAVIVGIIVGQEIELTGKKNQFLFILVCTLSLLILMIPLFAYAPHRTIITSSDSSWAQLMSQSGARIGLFALCLSVVIIISDFLSKLIPSLLVSRLLGAFGGFPLVPFFGLYSVAAAEGRTTNARLEDFGSLAVSVWLGPLIALAFIMSFSGYLQTRGRLYDREGRWVKRFVLAIPFWLACFFAIVPATVLIKILGR